MVDIKTAELISKKQDEKAQDDHFKAYFRSFKQMNLQVNQILKHSFETTSQYQTKEITDFH